MKQKLLMVLAIHFAIGSVFSQKTKYDSFSLPIKVKPGIKLSQPVVSGISPYRLVTCERPDIHVFPSNVPQSEVHVSINKINNQSLLLSSNTFPIGNSFQGAYWSNNSGANWQGDDILPNNGFGRGDPSTAYDALGRGYISSMGPNANDNPNSLLIMRTDNNGANWLPQVNATGIIPGLDKDMIAADDVATSPFANNLYCTWTVFGANTTVQFNRSTNGGITFSNPIVLRNGFGQGANVQTGPNGEVYVCWADYTNGQLPAQGLGFTRSLDGGVNFNAAAVVFNYSGIRVGNGADPNFNNTRVNDFPSMAVDKSNSPRRGRVYVVYAERENGSGKGIVRLRWSDNRGDTWSAPTTLSIPTARQSWMPWVSVDDANGNVFVTYFCMESQNSFNTNTYVAASVDGFTTFQNRIVSDVTHVTAPIPQFTGGYAGDYIGISANGGRAFAAWMDDRNGVWQNYISEVRAADIQLTGNPQLCSGTGTYTLTGAPAGAAINWQQPTPSGIVTMNTNGNVANLTKVGTGTVTLSAEVIDNGCSYGFFNIQIDVGSPLIQGYYVAQANGSVIKSSALLSNQLVSVSVPQSYTVQYSIELTQNLSSVTWNLYGIGNITSSTNTHLYWTMPAYGSSPNNCTVLLNAAMGSCPMSGVYPFQVIGLSGYGYSIIASPNPAINNINLQIVNTPDTTSTIIARTDISQPKFADDGFTKMYLYDFYSNSVIKQWQFAEAGSNTYNLNLLGVKSGTYILKMERNNKTATTKIIIQ